MSSSPYDYIILGAGCSGLSLAVRMLDSGLLNDKRLLIIDRSEKNTNDRTWCFWEKGEGYFDSIVHHSYDQLSVFGQKTGIQLDIAPYRYKMIRGIDFYQHCRKILSSTPQVEFRTGNVQVIASGGVSKILIDGEEFDIRGALVFNSIYNSKGNASLQLLQHFKGWVIKTQESVFDPLKATLMDFRVDQSEGTTFGYVLPISRNEALVEYTLFTPNLLEEPVYESALESYVRKYITKGPYEIKEKEWGVIPMNNERWTFFSGGHYQLGMAGGQTKPSTGYTFQFIQKQTAWIVACLTQGKSLLPKMETSSRFLFYDEVLLDLLERKMPPGDAIFTRLFERNKAGEVFKFLDNETSIVEELKLISSLPVWPFLKAALRRMTSRR